MQKRNTELLIALSVAIGTTLLISNLAATKLWDFCGVAIDGGIIIFPLSYILGDITVEFFGKKVANQIIFATLIMNFVAMVVFIVVGALPPFPEWENQIAYDAILGFTPRIIFGSLAAFTVSGFLNNYVFEEARRRRGNKFYQRALFSSAIGRFVDSAIFEIIAFAGVLSHEEFIKQMAFAYIAGMLLETALTPITSKIVYDLHNRLDF